MKRIALRWLGALLLSITLAAPALAAGKHLINGIDANYPPFAYVDDTGKPAGFDVDSMTASSPPCSPRRSTWSAPA